MVQSMPRQLQTSTLAYEESFTETGDSLAKNNLPQLHPVPSLTLTSLELESCLESLYSSLCFLLSMLLAFSVERDRFQLWSFQLTRVQLCSSQSLQEKELARSASTTEISLLRQSLRQLTARRAYSKSLWQLSLMAQFHDRPTRARELELNTAQLCKHQFAQDSLQQNELAAAYAFKAQTHGPTRARKALQVAGDLRRPESIHYDLLPQTMQRYLPLDDHDMYMDLRTVVQNNLARKGPDPAGAEELRYENVFPNPTTDSVDLVVKAETSYHPKRLAKNGVRGEIGSIHLRGGRSTTYLFKFVATFICGNLGELGIWPLARHRYECILCPHHGGLQGSE